MCLFSAQIPTDAPMTDQPRGAILALICSVVELDAVINTVTDTRFPRRLRFEASCSGFLEACLAVAQLIRARVLAVCVDRTGGAGVGSHSRFEEARSARSAHSTGRRGALESFLARLAALDGLVERLVSGRRYSVSCWAMQKSIDIIVLDPG